MLNSTEITKYVDKLMQIGIRDEEGIAEELKGYLNHVSKLYGRTYDSILSEISRGRVNTAIHESGHLIVKAAFHIPTSEVKIASVNKLITLTYLPPNITKKYRREVEKDCRGYSDLDPIWRPYTKDDFINRICAMYGGVCAEDYILGYHTSGCAKDIGKATDLLNNLYTLYGYGDYLLAPVGYNANLIEDKNLGKSVNEHVIAASKECRRRTESIVRTNADLILKCAEYLLTNPKHTLRAPICCLTDLIEFTDNPSLHSLEEEQTAEEYFDSNIGVDKLLKICNGGCTNTEQESQKEGNSDIDFFPTEEG